MNSEIKIVDNFLDEEDFKKIINIIGYTSWGLHSSSEFESTKESSILYSNLTDESFFNGYLFDKVVGQLDEDDYKLERIYLNGQWSGREGTFHKDGCDFTSLIYMTHYEYGWGGFTEIMTKPEPTLIYPIPNRLVIFPGNIFHKAYSFAYQNCPLRISLAFKIEKK